MAEKSRKETDNAVFIHRLSKMLPFILQPIPLQTKFCHTKMTVPIILSADAAPYLARQSNRSVQQANTLMNNGILSRSYMVQFFMLALQHSSLAKVDRIKSKIYY